MEAAGTDAVGGGGFLVGALGRPDAYVGPDATGTRVTWSASKDGAAPKGQGAMPGVRAGAPRPRPHTHTHTHTHTRKNSDSRGSPRSRCGERHLRADLQLSYRCP